MGNGLIFIIASILLMCLPMVVISFIVALIASPIEAYEYNYRKIAPINGKEKFKMRDFIISNFIYFAILYILHTFYIVIFGFSSLCLFTLVYAVIYSVTIDRGLLKKKVDSSKLLMVPMLARFLTHMISVAIISVFLVLY